MGISAVNTGNNLVYIIEAGFLSFLIISGMLGKRNLDRIDIELKSPDEIYAGIEFPLTVTVVNNRLFMPAFLIRVAVGGRTVLFPYTEQRGRLSNRITMTFDDRGFMGIDDVFISSVFPFNFFTRYRMIEKKHRFLVFARPAKCLEWGSFDREHRFRGEQTVDIRGFDADILSIRDYVEGDPMKYINWKASARSGILKTKELASTAVRPPVIDFDSFAAGHLEFKISCLTYIIMSFIRKNIPVGLKISGSYHQPAVSRGHKLRMLKDLALYGKDEPLHQS
ncbi:MAG: DUF58 domain-containing protein [Deltaproteobacteria bacterium]|nr:DUF58 domain-containing protein [Deltaproteobacteria bacterium]